jgi:TPR repeat protein
MKRTVLGEIAVGEQSRVMRNEKPGNLEGIVGRWETCGTSGSPSRDKENVSHPVTSKGEQEAADDTFYCKRARTAVCAVDTTTQDINDWRSTISALKTAFTFQTETVFESTESESKGSGTTAKISSPIPGGLSVYERLPTDIGSEEAELSFPFLENALEQIRCGHWADWEETLNLATNKGNPLAQAIVAICYIDSSVRIVPKSLPLTQRFGENCKDWLMNYYCSHVGEHANKICRQVAYLIGIFHFHGHIRTDRYMQSAVELFTYAASHIKPWKEDAAELTPTYEYAPAQFLLAFCYEKDFGSLRTCAASIRDETIVELYSRSAALGYAQAQNHLGLCFLRGSLGLQENLSRASELFLSAAEQGDCAAQYNLGWLYQFRKDAVAPNCHLRTCQQKALDWYAKAGAQNYAPAQCRLGQCYQYARLGLCDDKSAALQWYKLAARQSHPLALNALGECYLKGLGVNPDEARAVELFHKAIDAESSEKNRNAYEDSYDSDAAIQEGAAEALFNAGCCHEHGINGFPSISKAMKFYMPSAAKGSMRAQYKVASSYQYGSAIKLDLTAAIEWYTRAANQGHMESQNALGDCYQYGVGVEINLSEAAKHYMASAAQGNAVGQFSMAKLGHRLLLENASTVSNPVCDQLNSQQIALWYAKSAKQRHPEAQYRLGQCYETGFGVPKSLKKTLKLYGQAARNGVADAMNQLGLCYLYGQHGITKNEKLGMMWLRKAANPRAHNHSTAQHNLALALEQQDSIFEAEEYMEMAARQGNVEAQYWIGRHAFQQHTASLPTLRDSACIVRAVHYFNLAATQNFPPAQTALGLCFELGIGMQKDIKQAIRYYKLAAIMGQDASAQYNLACCYEQGSPDVAWKYYILSARQNYAPAMYRLGRCYHHEQLAVKKQDMTTAYRLYIKGALAGHVNAQLQVGYGLLTCDIPAKCWKHYSSDGPPIAAKFYAKAAAQGSAEAINMLGYCFQLGIGGCSRNINRAVKCYSLAAKRGHYSAAYNLARCLHLLALSGHCPANDGQHRHQKQQEYMTAAIKLYTRAATKGNIAAAQLNLGSCYYQGFGAATDKIQAVQWFLAAACQGEARACYCLAFCYMHGIGVDKNECEATRFFALAADDPCDLQLNSDVEKGVCTGHALAQFYLGYCYFTGIGVSTKNSKSAATLFWQSAMQGLPDAINAMGYCFQVGHGVPQNYQKAVALYTKAVKHGVAAAMSNLGNCYLQGYGVEKDVSKALILFTKGAKLAHPGALACIAYCYQNGIGVAADASKALKLAMLASKRGGDNYSEAQCVFGISSKLGRISEGSNPKKSE